MWLHTFHNDLRKLLEQRRVEWTLVLSFLVAILLQGQPSCFFQTPKYKVKSIDKVAFGHKVKCGYFAWGMLTNEFLHSVLLTYGL